MTVDPWMYAAIFGIAFVHLLAVAYVSRRRASTERGRNVETEGEGETIECTTCGTENGSEYRFCRRCVSELPGGIGRSTGGRSPAGRGIV